MKLCKDCRHYTASRRGDDPGGLYAKCSAPVLVAPVVSVVTGATTFNGGAPKYSFCELARGDDGQCGPEARLFEARAGAAKEAA